MPLVQELLFKTTGASPKDGLENTAEIRCFGGKGL